MWKACNTWNNFVADDFLVTLICPTLICCINDEHWLQNNADGLHFLGEKVSKKYGVEFHSKWGIIRKKKIGKQVPQSIEKVIS